MGHEGAEKDLGPAATALMKKEGTALRFVASVPDTKVLILAGKPLNEPIAAQVCAESMCEGCVRERACTPHSYQAMHAMTMMQAKCGRGGAVSCAGSFCDEHIRRDQASQHGLPERQDGPLKCKCLHVQSKRS